MPLTLKKLSEELQLPFQGDAALEVTGIASLESARAGDLCFVRQPALLSKALGSLCSVLIVPADMESLSTDKALIFSNNPQLSLVQAMSLVVPELVNDQHTGIHPSAQIADTAVLGAGVSVGALTVIEDAVTIGAGCNIGAGCIIGNHAIFGEQCYLHHQVTVAQRVQIGDRCRLHSGVVLGADGFGFIEDNQQWQRVPQIGTVILGRDVEIGAHTTVDRGSLDDTLIGDGCKLDNLIQVAHNVQIGAHTIISGCVGIAGSTTIGKYCKIAGGVAILDHLSIADGVTITATSLVMKDIKQSGVYSSGLPLLENSEWRKNSVRYKSLDQMARIVSRLDRQSKLLFESFFNEKY